MTKEQVHALVIGYTQKKYSGASEKHIYFREEEGVIQ